MSISAEAPKGRLEALIALRDALAAEIDNPRYGEKGAPPVAALAHELRLTLAEIEAIQKSLGTKGSVVDELAQRRRRSTESRRKAAGSD